MLLATLTVPEDFQSLNSAALLNTNQRLSDLQLSQIMEYLSDVPLVDPIKTLQYGLAMRNRRFHASRSGSEPFWHSPKLKEWSSASRSSLVAVKGNYQSRFEVKISV